MSAMTSALTAPVVRPLPPAAVKIVRLALRVDTQSFVGIRTVDFSRPFYYIIDSLRATIAFSSSVYSWY